MKQIAVILICLCFAFFACTRHDELSLEELEAMTTEGLAQILERTVTRPWRGEEFVPGTVGGTWNSVIAGDPKSFNHVIAEQDNQTAAVVRATTDFLSDYDVVAREWKPRIASGEIIINENDNTMELIFTLRDDLYWSYYNSDRRVRVTSDDVIFWYDEIVGDPAMQSSGFTGQFMTMPDGTSKRITIRRIDDRRFAFHFPKIVSEPFLMTNMDFGPRHVFEPALRQGGVEAVRSLFSVDVDPRTIPSMGQWFIVEYTPGQRVVFRRNPNYWRRNVYGVSIPYIEEHIMRIIPDENTQLLLFRTGETDSYSLRPEDIDSLVNRGDGSFTIFNSEGSLNAPFWSFNMNPNNNQNRLPQYEWFNHTEFRQAMSSLLNRDRINAQVYRGLAQPMLYIFPEPNAFHNPYITQQFLFDRQRAIELLASIGIERDARGVMRDWDNRRIEFDLAIRSGSSIMNDIAVIIMDELSQVGIRVNIRVLDFQLIVEQLFSSFEWHSVIIGLSGSGIFPSQGSNVWPSSGNLHLWHPNQESPARDWEARIDYLYNAGLSTLDPARAQEIWDEFQTIILYQCVMIHLMRPRGFWAINNRWDLTNVFFDNMNGIETSHIFLE